MYGSLLSTGVRYHSLPQNYVRPHSQRPQLSQVVSQPVPMIDLGGSNKDEIIRQIDEACRSFRFFQVINHGISPETMRKVMEIARQFFHLPVEEKMKYYSDDPSKKMRLSTSSNVRKEKVHNWRDYLRLHCHPLEEFVNDWPSTPSSFKVWITPETRRKDYNFSKLINNCITTVRTLNPYKQREFNDERDVVSTYCKEVRELGLKLVGVISESLGLEREYIEKVLGAQGQHMAINYYPPCPEPELTYGLPAHTDPNTLTILLMDNQVPGLQVLKNGEWVAVDPHPNALIVNIGDQMQALSNGTYKSSWHRAIVNSSEERISVATFFCPANDAVIAPAKKLTSEETPAIYRSFTYDEYYKSFWSRNLDDEHCLELFK